MATAIQWRRGTTSQHSSFTGLVGEITVDTDLNTVIVHDGSTAGGHRLAKYSDVGTQESIEDTVSGLLVGGTGVTITYDDAAGTLTIDGQTGDITGVTAGASLSGGGTSGAVTLAFDGSAVAQHILPSADITYDLGSSSKQWRDLYVGPGSLYVNGQKVIEDNSGTIQLSADANQNVGIITSGSGDVELNASGTGVVNIQSGMTFDASQVLTGTGGLTMGSNINLNSNSINNLPAPAQASDATNKTYVDAASYLTGGDGITNSTGTLAVDSTVVRTSGTQTVGGNKTFSNDIVVDGNFTVSGTTTTINTETLNLEDNIILLNSGTSGTPSENAGIQVDRGSSADVFLQYNETSDVWQFTNDGSTYVNIAVNTDGLVEGSSNLYFTNTRADTRADSRFDVKLAAASTGDLSEGSNLYYTNERVDDRVGAIMSGSGNISVTYDDSAGTITIAEALTTTDITEGDNLYFTNARADARISNAIVDEDNMASDSATQVPSQQSVKAYVDSSVAGKDNTDEIAEGSTNLYFTNARADARIAAASTSDLSEGTNLYYTNARADARITNALVDEDDMSSNSATKVPSQQSVKAYVDAQVDTADALSELSGDSDDITEGSTNLFHTSARVNTLIDSRVTNAFVDALNVDADTLDDLNSTQFLRSDANDTHSGTITPSSDNAVDLGSGSLRYNEVYAVTFQGTASSAQFADLAEKYETAEELEAGTVVCFGGDKEVEACKTPVCHKVAGVISTDPAYMMNSGGEGQYVALTGRVPCKVTGKVEKGDLIVSSNVEGHGMADNNAGPGRIIGKAVGSNEEGESVIEVLVNLM